MKLEAIRIRIMRVRGGCSEFIVKDVRVRVKDCEREDERLACVGLREG